MTATLAELPVTALRGVGPRLAERLARLHVHSVQDVLFHLPLRYQDRTRIAPIGALRPGDDVVIQGQVRLADVVRGRRRSLVCRLQDDTGLISLRFFHFSAAQHQQLQPGTWLRCVGEVRRGGTGLELVHPEYQLLDPRQPAPVEDTLTPVYPTTSGLHQRRWRQLTDAALALLEEASLEEGLDPGQLPAPFRMGLTEALRLLHRPPPTAPVAELLSGRHPAQRRLALEELLAHRLSLLQLRQAVRTEGAPVLPRDSELPGQLLARLPFVLTGAQRRVAGEVSRDLAQPRPMLRLVQGDVGSGKTVIAALAALQAVAAGHQVALMAPTELLAEQHFNSLQQWLAPLGVTLVRLGGRLRAGQRREVLEGLATGRADLAVGTHALFQEEVDFCRLGLVIIDEQHRFGVDQRLALRDKARGLQPHQLVMTATPIPRTLAMSAYADLDTSLIDELPPGRQPVTTVAIDNLRRPEVVERIRAACGEGRQAYWVCTLIEESDHLQAQAAEATWQELAEALPELRVGLIHGRLRGDDKAAVMAAFAAGELDLLVATTVIEVGVDVPNASLMVIENAERLGLAQLHQLRGRVGRGATASHCVLLYQHPLGAQGRARLGVMRQTNDGFAIAEHDLELRGPGELLGTRQTGLAQMRIADLLRDADLLDTVAELAEPLLRTHPDVAEVLIRRWLPNADRYARV